MGTSWVCEGGGALVYVALISWLDTHYGSSVSAAWMQLSDYNMLELLHIQSSYILFKLERIVFSEMYNLCELLLLMANFCFTKPLFWCTFLTFIVEGTVFLYNNGSLPFHCLHLSLQSCNTYIERSLVLPLLHESVKSRAKRRREWAN